MRKNLQITNMHNNTLISDKSVNQEKSLSITNNKYAQEHLTK